MKQGIVLWLMGPTSAGKTTIAESFVQFMRSMDKPAIHYDGDEVRHLFGDLIGFKDSDRFRVVKSLCYMVDKARQSGAVVVVSALTSGNDSRDFIQANIDQLRIIYVKCSIPTCIARDPKGLYKKALRGEIDTVKGINSEYLPPDNPYMIIDTEKNNTHACVSSLYEKLESDNDIVT